MNIYALTTGIAIAVYIILRFRKTGLERSSLAYPLLLASFPIYYFAFAVYAGDLNILLYEILVGLLFVSVAFFAFKSKQKAMALLAGGGCLLHAFYDAGHDLLFINSGTPGWWLEFCGSIDVILGIYLVYLATRIPGRSLDRLRETA